MNETWLTRAMTIWLACLTAAGIAAQTRPAGADRHVIVISLDGFPAYALRDRTIPFPVLRRFIREGASADAMNPVNPTVTWPNHTAMISGVGPDRHGVIYNGMPIRPGEGKPLRIEPWVPKTELVQARTVYDAAHEAGLTTAEVDWVAIYHPPTIDWSFAEVPSAQGAVEREMLASGELTEDELREWKATNNTLHDDVWTRAAVHIIEKHKPNLLMLHLLNTDSVQHQYGARSLASNTALILADRQIQRIVDACERAGIRDRTTILVVSDHGFRTYQHLIRPNALFRQKNLLRDVNGQTDCDAWAIAEGGTAMVYITRELKRAETSQTLSGILPGINGVIKVITPAEYPQYGFPAAGGRMSDLVLAAAPGYSFDGGTKGEVITDVPAGSSPGSHGYLNSDSDMQAILVAWGAGIRTGAHLPAVTNVSVAPTIARLLQLTNFQVAAPALTGMLQP